MENITHALPARQGPIYPPRGLADPTDSGEEPLDQLRRRRAVALMPTVREIDGGFRVASARRPLEYLVTRPNGEWMCSCADYQRHADQDAFRCKHILAVEMTLEEGMVPQHQTQREDAASNPDRNLTVLHRYQPSEDRVRLKLTKNTRGYSWEISAAEENGDLAMAVVQALEEKVKRAFGEAAESN